MKRKALKERILELCGDEYSQALDILPCVKHAIGGKGGRIYACVNTVARSGMSRTITLAVVCGGRIINLNHTPYALVYGDQIKDGTVRIYGCGMDMLFSATYRLYGFLFDQNKRPYQSHLNQYITL